jgi:cephalosporin hydroxylase
LVTSDTLACASYTEAVLNQQSEDYLRWYYDSLVWTRTNFLGVPCLKSVTDMWNYQEIIASLRPRLLVEFGVHQGGSSLFFATIAGLTDPESLLLCVDVDLSKVSPALRLHNRIRWIESSSTDPAVAQTIVDLRRTLGGLMFVVLDSDHSQAHVRSELELLRPITIPGDYVVVEDSILNGHPVWPEWGGGPMEAIREYTARYPDEYLEDTEREQKFGFTFAPRGFLIRR